MEKVARELVKVARVLTAGPIADKVEEGLLASQGIIRGLEGVMSERGSLSRGYWKPNLMKTYNKLLDRFDKYDGDQGDLFWLVADTKKLLANLIDGLEGVESAEGEVPRRYWKPGVLKRAKNAYRDLKRVRTIQL